MYISLLETRDIFCFLPYHTYLKLILNRFFINYIDNHFLYRNAFLLAYVFWKTKFVTLVSISVWHIHSNLVLGYLRRFLVNSHIDPFINSRSH